MPSADLGKLIACNEKKSTPDDKISRKKSYVLGSKPGCRRLYTPETSWVRFQFASGKVEYHPLKKINPGNKTMQPRGAFGYVRISPKPLEYIRGSLKPLGKVYAEKIQEREDYHSSRSFEIQLMYEWECMREIYGDIPKPTFIRDDKGEYLKAYQAMPYFKGMTLRKYKLMYCEKASDSDLLTIIINMMQQIKNVHDKQMLHRDIRLENFIVDPDTLMVTLIDFGLSSLDVEKERQFCEKHHMIMQPAEDIIVGRWWELYHFRGAVYDFISDNKNMTLHYKFLDEIFHCLHSPPHSIFPSLNWMILKTEQLRDDILKAGSGKRMK